VEHKLFTANATTYTFSGLDGNTDGTYLMVADLINNHSGGCNYNIAPNGSSTGLHSLLKWFSYAGGETSGSIAGTDNVVGFAGAVSTWAHFEIEISARKTAHSINKALNYSGTGFTWDGSGNYTWVVGGAQLEYTNLTSIDIVASQSDGLGDGSEVILWKYSQT
jgi:hypothetical protein